MNEREKIINERANIIDIIKRWHCAQSRDINGHTIWLTDDNERLADALIANGYGDVAEWKRRAEVAEKSATTWKDCATKWQKYYKEQAEREIEEERK